MKSRLRTQTGNLNEFSFALLIGLILFAFPLIDLFGVATGAGIACLIAHQAATRAASHQRYDSALAAMTNEAQILLGTGFANFARMTPAGGYNGTGADLWVVATNYRGGGTSSYGPNIPVTTAIDPSMYLYECNVRVKYNIGPTVSLAGTPLIGNVPGLGKPFTLSFEANRAAEYPMGLNKSTDPTNNGGGGVVGAVNIPFDAAYSGNGSSWNFPGLYQIISMSGSTSLDDDVVVVAANNPKWTQTHFNTASFNKLYLDVRSDGGWSTGPPPAPTLTANGDTKNLAGNGLPVGALIGKIGGGAPFVLGTSQMGMSVVTNNPGTLYLAMNVGNGPDSDPATAALYAKCKGAQLVRLVAAR